MAVSIEEVVWCYQNFLQREPESEEAIAAHLDWPDFRQLVLAFTSAEEFRSPRPNMHPPSAIQPATTQPATDANFWLPSVLPKLNIDIDANAKELGKCAARIKEAWEHLGEERAHYSVLSSESFMPANLDGSIDSFWATGEVEAAQAVRALDLYGSTSPGGKVCVEYGCGVGRVTVNFAKSFKFVHAYDISRNHLDLAKVRTNEVGANNITFHECAEDFRVAMEPCDFFYSVIVLQHNPPPVIAELIRIALTALKPGGIAMFQVPTHIIGYEFSLKKWLATNHALDMQMHCVPQETILQTISATGCRLVGLREDGCTGARGQIISNTFFCRK